MHNIEGKKYVVHVTAALGANSKEVQAIRPYGTERESGGKTTKRRRSFKS
jgi:hypothetical protein